jgi:hypothetical protein
LARPELELAAGIDPNAPTTWRKINRLVILPQQNRLSELILMAALPSELIRLRIDRDVVAA